MKYPKEIFVQREVDGDSYFLLAQEKAEESNDGEIAVYELKKVGKKKTLTEVTFK